MRLVRCSRASPSRSGGDPGPEQAGRRLVAAGEASPVGEVAGQVGFGGAQWLRDECRGERRQ